MGESALADIRVMLVEDDQRYGELLRDYLLQQGIQVRWLQNGSTVESDIADFDPHILVLDLMLPGIGGIDICRKIRDDFHGYIIFLTSSDDDIDHVACLEVGGDDFLSKPIRPRVLLARIQMLLRSRNATRKSSANVCDGTLVVNGLKLKRNTREVTLSEQPVKLTASEFDLLWVLSSNAGEVLNRDYLFKELRGIEFDGIDRSVDTKIVSLRKKLSDTGDVQKKIVTVRNQGYMLVAENCI